MGDEIGQRLNSFENLSVLKHKSAEKLQDFLRSIRRPYQILNIYADNGNHYAWILADKKIKLERD